MSPAPPVITAPFFEIGPKNLLRLPEILEVAHSAAHVGRESGVSVIITVPAPLISRIRDAVPGVFVFAQAMDDDEQGPSVGRITAEALVDSGAHGVMLNHDSHPLERSTLLRTVGRATGAGLMTMVCAGSDAQALDLARIEPTILLYEPPELIGGAAGGDRPWIRAIDPRVSAVAPTVLMMHAGGVAVPDDAYGIMRSGARGTGSTSGVLRADSPPEAAAQFILAVRRGFDSAAESNPR